MLILSESEIRGLADAANARDVVREAFRALQRGEATLPGVISLPFRRPEGLAHIKAGHLHSDAVWTVKVSTDIEPDDGDPTLHNGLMVVISVVDGALAGLLLDNGYLTDLRTGAAGGVAADLLAREDAKTVAIIGAGKQARFQLEAVLQVRQLETVRVASRLMERAQAFVGEVETRWRLAAELCPSVEEAVRGADIVITTTPSTSPLVQADWLDAGVHVTAVGSDEPTKQELHAEVLGRADVIAVDDRSQASRFGELHHGLDSGSVDEARVVTLGELLEGAAAGRTGSEDITVADLTGVGVQDAAIAALVVREATRAAAERLR
jgi:ornithine cyclodeaminase/alanine dehydrogenase-like protein (mu-crystallin family)